jgi:hypothetical protein
MDKKDKTILLLGIILGVIVLGVTGIVVYNMGVQTGIDKLSLDIATKLVSGQTPVITTHVGNQSLIIPLKYGG